MTTEYLSACRWAVEIAGRKYPARVSLRPFYDPDNLRIKS